jgi:hypothetical protein
VAALQPCRRICCHVKRNTLHFTSATVSLMFAGKMNGKYRKEKHINDRRENRKKA